MQAPTQAQREQCLQMIKGCRTLAQAREIHYRIQPMLGNDVLLSNMVVHMYGRCKSPDLARRMFDQINPKSSFSWDLMLTAYARNGHLDEARSLFECMPVKHLVPTTSLLVAYARYGHLKEAKKLFDSMPERDLVCWTTMLDAYARNGHMEQAKHVFDCMPERDTVCWTSLQAAYSQNGYVEEAKSVFDSVPEKDVVTWTTMVAAYTQNGYLEEARAVFDEMAEKNLVTWTLMLCGYAERGNMQQVKKLFDAMPERDFILWNSMVGAYAQNDLSDMALAFFHEMNTTEGPDEVCMICVLVACSRGGTLETGRAYFHSIVADYGLRLTKQHYSCMVDLLCKSKHLGAAEELIHHQPFTPEKEDWKSLLGACASIKDCHGTAARATEKLVELDPRNSACYSLFANTKETRQT